MTISRERRHGDQALALRTMAADVGDSALFERFWAAGEERFAQLVPTTWAELEEKGLVARRRVFGVGPQYHLTEAGWVSGLELAGALGDERLVSRCVHLVRYFKSLVDGRRASSDVIVSHHEAQAAGFPFGWLLNALKAGLLQEMFPDKRMNAHWDTRSKAVRVPVTFGMPID